MKLMVHPTNQIRPHYEEVLRRLDQMGVEYCLLRRPIPQESQEILEGDLDVFVSKSTLRVCEELLRQEGFLLKPVSPVPYKKVFLKFDRGEEYCIDLHWKAIQYGIIYMDDQRILGRRFQIEGIYCLSPEDELIHLILHNFLRRGPLRESALGRIRILLDGTLDQAYLRDHLEPMGLWPSFKESCLVLKSTEIPSELIARLRRLMVYKALFSHPGNLYRYAVYQTKRILPFRRRGGLVAVVGPDGSGKSTVIGEIRRKAESIHGLKIKTVYLGPWGQMAKPWIGWLRRFGIKPSMEPWGRTLADRILKRPGNPYHEGKRISSVTLILKWVKSFFKGSIFYGVTFAELCYRYWTSVFREVRKGRWIVADRYITDLRYLYKSDPIPHHRFLRFLVCQLYPTPDLFILLDNEAEVIHSRKTDLTVEQIHQFRFFYARTIQRLPHRVVSTDRPPAAIADVIISHIFSLSVTGRPFDSGESREESLKGSGRIK